MVEYDCDYCGKRSSKYLCLYKRDNNHFCSKKCRYLFLSKSFKGNSRASKQRIKGDKIKCSACKEVKQAPEFYKSKFHKDGFDYKCKACRKESSIIQATGMAREKKKARGRRHASKLGDGYLINEMKKQGFPKEYITKDLIEAKRLIIKTKRLIKNK